jgi:hypothetical protein
MKKPVASQTNSNPTSGSRREIIKGVAAAATLALLPASRLMATARSQAAAASDAPSLAMGYWHRSEDGTADVILDTASLAAAAGAFELRVARVETGVALTMDAHYLDGAHHRFWQAWSERGLLQRSPTSAIRWSAEGGKPLPLNISLRGEATRTQMTARPGTYVLAIGPQTQRLPTWSKLALRPRGASNKEDFELVSRSDGGAVDFPYVLFTVRQISA